MRRMYEISDIKKIINAEYPDYKINLVETLGMGMDCEAYLVNCEFVFKLPKHQLASSNLYREKSILLQIADQLPFHVPRIEFAGEPNVFFDKYFIGYKKVNGEILTAKLFHTLSDEIKNQIYKDMAHFLKVLHRIEIFGNIDGLIVDRKERFKHDYEKIKKILLPILSVSQWKKVQKMYEELFEYEFLYDYTKGLIHNDFDGGHILFDNVSKRICGVIDFGSAQISDCDNDFMMLIIDSVEEYGEELGLKVLEYYEHPDITNVFLKANTIEKYWMFQQVLFSVEFNDDAWYNDGLKKIKSL